MSKKFQNLLLDVYDIISFLVFILGIIVFFRFFIASPFTVIGDSMYPTLEEKNVIVVDKISSKLAHRDRGDIIIFVPPGQDVPFVKRIVGLPGEIVKIKDGKVLICDENNGKDVCRELDEDYLKDSVKTVARCGVTEFFVDEGFFVLGDNRGLSTDSLCCFGVGCMEDAEFTVPYENIIGKVWMRIFPNLQPF